MEKNSTKHFRFRQIKLWHSVEEYAIMFTWAIFLACPTGRAAMGQCEMTLLTAKGRRNGRTVTVSVTCRSVISSKVGRKQQVCILKILRGIHMKKRIKLKGRIKTYIQFCIYLGVLCCIVDVAMFMIDYRAGTLLAGYILFYFAITLSLYFYNKSCLLYTSDAADD